MGLSLAPYPDTLLLLRFMFRNVSSAFLQYGYKLDTLLF